MTGEEDAKRRLGTSAGDPVGGPVSSPMPGYAYAPAANTGDDLESVIPGRTQTPNTEAAVPSGAPAVSEAARAATEAEEAEEDATDAAEVAEAAAATSEESSQAATDAAAEVKQIGQQMLAALDRLPGKIAEALSPEEQSAADTELDFTQEAEQADAAAAVGTDPQGPPQSRSQVREGLQSADQVSPEITDNRPTNSHWYTRPRWGKGS